MRKAVQPFAARLWMRMHEALELAAAERSRTTDRRIAQVCVRGVLSQIEVLSVVRKSVPGEEYEHRVLSARHLGNLAEHAHDVLLCRLLGHIDRVSGKDSDMDAFSADQSSSPDAKRGRDGSGVLRWKLEIQLAARERKLTGSDDQRKK